MCCYLCDPTYINLTCGPQRLVLELPTAMVSFLCAFGLVALLQVPGTFGEDVDPFAVRTKDISSLITYFFFFTVVNCWFQCAINQFSFFLFTSKNPVCRRERVSVIIIHVCIVYVCIFKIRVMLCFIVFVFRPCPGLFLRPKWNCEQA